MELAAQEHLDLVEWPRMRSPLLQDYGLREVKVPAEQKIPGSQKETDRNPGKRSEDTPQDGRTRSPGKKSGHIKRFLAQKDKAR